MSLKSSGIIAALLGPDLDVALQMHWAVRLAAARKMDLLILHRIESPEKRVIEVSFDEPAGKEAMGVINKVRRIIEESPALRAGPRESTGSDDGKETKAHFVHVRLKLIYFKSLSSLRQAVLDELEKEDVEIITQAREQIADMSDVDLVRERRLFLRYIPYEVVLCLGIEKENALSRILVAEAPGQIGRAALHLGQALAAAAKGTMTVLHVNPRVGIDAERVGMLRLKRHIRKSLDTE
jgi:hypothetical protein